MTEIFEFFLRLIELHVNCFRTSTVIGEANSHKRVVQVVLETLTGFSEWVSINHIMTLEGKLLQILCILLIDDSFQLPAAECLLQIVNRKGQLKDRKPLLLLFGEDAMSYIYRAANLDQSATSSSSALGNSTTNNLNENKITEKYYMFLKKLVLVCIYKKGRVK